MADNISALLGMGLSPQDDMKALASSLRGDQGVGDYYSMSTLAPIAQMGKTLQGRATDAAKRGGVLRQAMEKEATRKAEREQDYTRNTEAQSVLAKAKLGAAQKLADEKASKRTLESFWHPQEQGKVLNLERAGDGNYYDQAGQVYDPAVVQTLTPYKAGQEGSKQSITAQKYADEKVQKERESLLGADVISGALTSPYMSAATGSFYDVPKQIAKHTGLLPEVQSQQNVLNEVSLEAASPTLAKLGVNPTDKDLQVAFESVPSTSDQPRVWIDWYKNRYMPRLLSGIRNGRTPEVEAQVVEEMNQVIADAEANLKAEDDSGFLTPPTMSPEDVKETTSNDGWSIKVKQ